MIYLDANALLPLLPGVKDTLRRILDEQAYGNPSSTHIAGQRARAAVENARASVLRLCGADSSYELIFTSGATEAVNSVLGPLLSPKCAQEKPNFVISSVEHAAVYETARLLEKSGIELRIIGHENGVWHPERFKEACDKNTRICAVMLANNETGQILPVKEIVSAVKSSFPGCIFLCDAAQAAGKIKFSVADIGADAYSFSACKIGGLPGCGCLIKKKSAELPPFISGGPQEQFQRAGTENISGIIAFGKAAALTLDGLSERISKMEEARDTLLQNLKALIPEMIQNTFSGLSLPNTLSLRFPAPGSDMVVALDLQGVCASYGSACSSGKLSPSRVLVSMGLPAKEALCSIRVSVPPDLSDLELTGAGEAILRAFRQISA